jgi:hypothetical protein
VDATATVPAIANASAEKTVFLMSRLRPLETCGAARTLALPRRSR